MQALFLDEQDEGTKYLRDIFSNIIFDKNEFSVFFEKVLEGLLYQLWERYFVHLPIGLVEDREYQGEVKIACDNFDGRDYRGFVRLDKFCFYVKLAAVFHAKHVNPSFDPWEGFETLDEMQRRYYPWPQIQA